MACPAIWDLWSSSSPVISARFVLSLCTSCRCLQVLTHGSCSPLIPALAFPLGAAALCSWGGDWGKLLVYTWKREENFSPQSCAGVSRDLFRSLVRGGCRAGPAAAPAAVRTCESRFQSYFFFFSWKESKIWVSKRNLECEEELLKRGGWRSLAFEEKPLSFEWFGVKINTISSQLSDVHGVRAWICKGIICGYLKRAR